MLDLKLEIRRNVDGETVVDVWQHWEYNTYWWSDGSASCDCNRQLFFARASQRDEPAHPKCGEGGFSVRLSNAATGQILYDELLLREGA